MRPILLPTILTRATEGPGSNWFIEADGTCGDPPDNSLNTQGAFIGFLILALALAAFSGIANFISLLQATKKLELFKHSVYQAIVINVIASIIIPILAVTAFKKDEDTYTWHNFHVVAWTVFFGFRPGAMMGIMQIFKYKEFSCAAAAGQMIPDMLFQLVGCIVALASENGSVVAVAYGKYRTAVIAGISLLLAHLFFLVVIYLVYRPNSEEKTPEKRYEVFESDFGKFWVFLLGLLSVTGSMIMMIVGSKMCGKLTTFIDAMCQVVQVAFSVGWACI